ncbi:NAD(P)/FAD-dependent oxidoreductase [Allorhizobium borbori]|uniref:Glycine oxidase n=1 Tax=Allorhizobium borbori TaxID=485907 RepID=A0A7W6JYI0_9HYPH|nr:FAD-binding oxidoreductase [Allorhizobium borbori]MBB4101909.1 glycine oxidase [Allorhizobium borbori]
MSSADNPALPDGQSSLTTDILVIGGGVMGLWAAVEAARSGAEVLLVDAGALGQGASHGVVGALMPHMPDKWNQKKQFQFDALVSLESEVAALEAETGLSAGYRRSGRLVPLPKPHLRDIALRHQADAETVWQAGERRFHWHVLDTPPVENWVRADAGAHGFVFDTLAARAAPRRVTAVLIAWLRMQTNVRILEQARVVHLDPAGMALLGGGRELRFGHAIVAAGHEAFPMLAAMSASPTRPLGQPVKGQSALLKASVDPAFPVIFFGGLYVIPHEDGHVAIGSTSEEAFDDPFACDGQIDLLIAKAASIVPALEGAPVVERWAGLRPKAIGRDPMVGPHPDHPRIIAMAGGFKVSFGLAHLLAKSALAAVKGNVLPVPESFLTASHIALAESR